MPAEYPRESEYAKEARKHEAQHSVYGPPGRPYVKRDFPMMLHRAGRRDGVTPDIIETKIVDFSERESVSDAMDRERSIGFYQTPIAALEAFQQLDLEIAKLAAERSYDARHKLSPKAGAEVAAAEDAHSGHLPSMPVTPIRRKPGRPAKQAALAAAGA